MTFPINGGGFFNPVLSRPPRRGQVSFPLQTNGVANLALTPEDLISLNKMIVDVDEENVIKAQCDEENVVRVLVEDC